VPHFRFQPPGKPPPSQQSFFSQLTCPGGPGRVLWWGAVGKWETVRNCAAKKSWVIQKQFFRLRLTRPVRQLVVVCGLLGGLGWWPAVVVVAGWLYASR
jgi:hypothetical protein